MFTGFPSGPGPATRTTGDLLVVELLIRVLLLPTFSSVLLVHVETGIPGSAGGFVNSDVLLRWSLTPRFPLGPYVAKWLHDFISPGFYRGSELGSPLTQVPAGGIFYSVFLPRGSLVAQVPSGTAFHTLPTPGHCTVCSSLWHLEFIWFPVFGLMPSFPLGPWMLDVSLSYKLFCWSSWCGDPELEQVTHFHLGAWSLGFPSEGSLIPRFPLGLSQLDQTTAAVMCGCLCRLILAMKTPARVRRAAVSDMPWPERAGICLHSEFGHQKRPRYRDQTQNTNIVCHNITFFQNTLPTFSSSGFFFGHTGALNYLFSHCAKFQQLKKKFGPPTKKPVDAHVSDSVWKFETS